MLEADDWYLLISDVWVKAQAQIFPADFTSLVTRAVVLDGPVTGPFGSDLGTAQIFSILHNRNVSFVMQDVVDAVDRLLQRGLHYRVAGPNRAEYIKPENQVPPMSEGGAGFGDAVTATAVSVVRRGPQGETGEAGEGSQGEQGVSGPAGGPLVSRAFSWTGAQPQVASLAVGEVLLVISDAQTQSLTLNFPASPSVDAKLSVIVFPGGIIDQDLIFVAADSADSIVTPFGLATGTQTLNENTPGITDGVVIIFQYVSIPAVGMGWITVGFHQDIP